MDEIQNIIQTIIDVDVDFDTPKSLGLSSIKKTFKQETIVSETTFHRGLYVQDKDWKLMEV